MNIPTAPASAVQPRPWFVYNSLKMAVVCLERRNYLAAEIALFQAKSFLKG